MAKALFVSDWNPSEIVNHDQLVAALRTHLGEQRFVWQLAQVERQPNEMEESVLQKAHAFLTDAMQQ